MQCMRVQCTQQCSLYRYVLSMMWSVIVHSSLSYVVSVVSFLQRGCTPLWVAASGGHSEVVSLLLERGADKEARDTEVSTPCC